MLETYLETLHHGIVIYTDGLVTRNQPVWSLIVEKAVGRYTKTVQPTKSSCPVSPWIFNSTYAFGLLVE